MSDKEAKNYGTFKFKIYFQSSNQSFFASNVDLPASLNLTDLIGHFVTMLGVLGFYCMLLDSKLEKKIVALLHTIVARFNKRALYYLGKLVFFKLNTSSNKLLPSRLAQKNLY